MCLTALSYWASSLYRTLSFVFTIAFREALSKSKPSENTLLPSGFRLKLPSFHVGILAIILGLSVGNAEAQGVTVYSDTVSSNFSAPILFNTMLPNQSPAEDVTLSVWGSGDLGSSSSEYFDVFSENNTLIGRWALPRECQPSDSVNFIVPRDSFAAWSADGTVGFICIGSIGVNVCLPTLSTYIVARYKVSSALNDAAVISINSENGYVCGGSQVVEATVANFGINKINSLTVNWSVNGIAQTAAGISGTLDTIGGAGSQTQSVNLGNFAFVTGNSYLIKVWTSAPNGGVDTVNSNDTLTKLVKAGLSGSYTIGGASPDYASFTAAVNDLKAKGICDSVIFKVRSNTYIEQIRIGKIGGTNSNAWVVFESETGDSSDVILTHSSISSANYTLLIDSTSFITFNKLTLKAESTSYGRIVEIRGPTNQIKFTNNHFLGVATTTSTLRTLVNYPTINSMPENHYYANNRFENGSYGLDYYSTDPSDGLVIMNNRFINQYYYGIDIIRADNAIVENNYINANSAYPNFFGIRLGSGTMTSRVVGNRITGSIGGYGIYYNQSSDISTPGLIANNYVSMGMSIYGCYAIFVASASNQNIYHNTVNIHNNSSTGSYGLYISGGSGNRVANNLVSSDAGRALYVGSSFNVTYSDHNNFYNNLAPFAYWGGNVNSLAELQVQSGKDSNSYSLTPFFVADTSFQTAQTTFNNKGTPVTEVTDDIEGEARSLTTPDIGADEFTPPPNDAGVVSFISPNTPFSPGSYNLKAVVKNYGNAALTSVNVEWELNGIAQSVVSWTGSIASGDTGHVSLSAVNLMSLNTYSLTANTTSPNGAADASASNDTSKKVDIRPALGGVYTLGGTSPDFTSFTHAALWLNNAGVYDSVVINVRMGTYAEQIKLYTIPGADSSHTICFQSESGDSSDTKLSFNPSSADPYIIYLDGASWLRFKRLGLEVPTSLYQRIVTFDNNSHHNKFINVYFSGNNFSTSSTTWRTLVYGVAYFEHSSNHFQSCQFSNAAYAFYWLNYSSNTDDLRIENCTFMNQNYNPIYIRGIDNLKFNGNYLNNDLAQLTTAYTAVYLADIDDGEFTKNRIYTGVQTKGLLLSDVDGIGANRFLVANNFIQSAGSGGNYYSAYLDGCNQLDFVYNSLSSFCDFGTSPVMDYRYNTNSSLRNNIFQHNKNGYAINTPVTSYLFNSDYNNLYTNGAILGSWGNSTQADLMAWQAATGLDSNSISVDAQFSDTNDLHVAASALNAAAMPFGAVTTDIDMEARDPGTPDIGADEFGLAADDAGVTAINTPAIPFAPGNQSVSVNFLNNGAATLNSVAINWTVNGVLQTPLNWTGTLLSGATATGVGVGSFTFLTDSGYCIKAWTSLPNGNSDAQASNDTSEQCDLYTGLSGIYTIGGINPDFPDFTAAVRALHLGGVTGWVNFMVRDSSYAEQIQIREIRGASATDSVAFIGENDTSSMVTLTHNSTFQRNWVLGLFGADFISFKDIDFTSNIVAFNSYQTCVRIDSSATNNRFYRCIFTSLSTTNTSSTAASLVFYNSTFNNHNNQFMYCDFEKGGYGIYLRGINTNNLDSGTVVMNSRFINQYYRGFYSVYEADLVFSMNEISSNSLLSSYQGTYIQYCRGLRFESNRYAGINNQGGYFYDVDGYSALMPSVIANNFVHVQGTGSGYGFSISFNDNVILAHNSFNITNSNTATPAVYFAYNADLSSYNNSFQNIGGGTAMRRTSSVTLVGTDHNNYYATGTNLIQDWNATYMDLPSFVAAKTIDSNSISVDPQYADTTDLHVASVLLDEAGMPIPEVTMDIDKEPRSPLTPDIGADEFSTNSDDAAIVAISHPSVPFATGINPVKVSLLNNGADTLKSVNIYFSVNDSTPILYAWTGNLAPGFTEDSVMLGTANFTPDTSYKIRSWTDLPNGQTDIQPQNDTAEVTDLYPALAGTYTIGGVNPDFTDFTSATMALNRGGVVAAVKFMVRDGVYNEQIQIVDVPGTTSQDSICFMAETGDSSTVLITYSANSTDRHTLLLTSASYITFKGIGFRGEQISYGDVVKLELGSHHVRFLNCSFDRATSSSGSGIVINGNTLSNHDIIIEHSYFNRGSYGIYELGSSINAAGLRIAQNQFMNQNYRAIEISDFDDLNIYRNWIRTTNGTTSSYIGIYLLSCDVNIRVSKNYINAPFKGDGLLLSSCHGTLGNEIIVDNNFVIVGDSATISYDVQGLYLASCSYVKVYYNSIHSVSPYAFSEAVLLSSNSNFELKNNVFVNSGTGYALYLSSGVTNFSSDYNDLYATGTNLTHYPSSEQADLAGWQAVSGQDANSVSADPDFVAPNDLHMRQPLLDSAAMVIAGFTLDYDCETRDTAKPDIGADELLFFPDDLKMQALVSPSNECGLSDSSMITVEVFNAGNDDQSGFDIAMEIDGIAVTENVGALNFPSRQVVLYTFTTKFDLSSYKTYVVKTWTDLTNDVYRDNDTLNTSISNFPPPVTSVTASQSVCQGSIVNLTATGGVSYLWSNSLAGASIFVAPTFTTTYWVKVTDVNGCVAYDTTTVIVSDSTDQVFRTLYTCDTALVGVETVTLTNQGGCDSIVTTTFLYSPATYDTLPAVIICGNDSSLIFGMYQSIAGLYYDTLASTLGCDSILVQELRIDSAYKYVASDISICSGDSTMIFGNWQSVAGLYNQTLVALNGCDSIVCQTLIVNPVYEDSDTNTICAGDSILLAGAYRTMTGMYPEILSSQANCDSTINHYLEVVPAINNNRTMEICDGDSLWLAGAYQTIAGVYIDNLVSVDACDSIVTTTLIVNPNYSTNQVINILQGDSVMLNGRWLSMAGVYYDTLFSQKACDSIVVTSLNVNSPARTLSFSSNSSFTNSLISPLQGTPYNTFNFEVVYTDSSGAVPPFGYPRVILDYEGNGSYTNPNDRYVLLQEADVNDQDAADGKLYVGSVVALPLGKNYQVLAQVIVGSDNIIFGPFNHPDILVEPDLQIFANDITFSNNNPTVSSPLTVYANVTNVSDLPAQNFVVHLENQNDTGAAYPDIVVANLGAKSSTTVQWNITTPPIPSWNPMQVFVDHTNVIAETNELDNNAVRPFVNGAYNVPGDIIVAASATPGNACSGPGKSITVSGFAYYINTAVKLTDSTVAGAEVNFSTNGAQYTTTTNSNGYFSLTVPAPLVQNSYVVSGTVTDFTLTGPFSASYAIQDCPCTLPDLRTIASPRFITIFMGDSISGLFNVKNVGCVAAPVNLMTMSQNGGSPTIPNTNIPMLNVGDTFNYHVNDIVFSTPGVYSICATADGGFAIQELSEYNNTGCIVVRVLAPTIDLYPYGAPSGTGYVCSNQANPTISVRNGGTVASGPFVTKVRVYMHGVLVDSVYHSFAGLAANAAASFSFPFTYPDTGKYQFEVLVDTNLVSGGQVAEYNEVNNAGTFNRYLIPCKPDLIISDCRNLQVSPVDPTYPGTVTYQATVRNGGNATAVAPIDVSFSVMPGVTTSAQILNDLTPGQSTVVTVTVPSVQPATANLFVHADPQNLINEFSESNNTGQDSLCWEFAPVTPCGGGFWGKQYRINTLVNVYLGLKTLHLYEASSVDVKYEVSGPGITGTQDLGTFAVANVKKDCGCPRVISLPNGFIFAQTGTYTFTFTVDPNNVYSECNEANNVLSVDVDAYDSPDMRVLSQFINPSKLNPDLGESITVDVSYENIGVSNVNAQMELKLSIDNIPLDSIKPVPGLVTGDNTTFSIPASWFSNVPGAHIIRAYIDSDNEISEINELNNEATRAIVVGEAANLLFAYFKSDDSSPAIGDTVEIEFIIGNNGDVDAMADMRVSYVNDFSDTITIGSIPISVLKQDSTGVLSIPWVVVDNNTTLVGELVNTNTLEWSYEDNTAYDSLGAFDVIITSAPSCFSAPNGWLKATPIGGIQPYNYSWSNGAIGDSITGGPGNYFVDITDADGVSVRAFGKVDTIPGSLNELPTLMVCQGDSMMIFGEWRSQAGVFYDTLNSNLGCDSILKQQLNIKPIYQSYETITVCGSQPITMVQVDTLVAMNGCDSIHTTLINYVPYASGSQNLSICLGDSVLIGGMYESTSGVYMDTIHVFGGCDSILTVQLNVVNPYSAMLSALRICSGDSVMIFGQWQSMSGTYYDSLLGMAGCDSVLAVNLMVDPVYMANDSAFICQGDSLYLGGGWRTVSGIYADTLQTLAGCDSIIYTDLMVGSGVLYTVTNSICQGDSLWAGGAWQTSIGLYYDTMSTASGCDSIKLTDLSVLPASITNSTASICDGDSMYLGGGWQSTAGLYYDTISAFGSCDSIMVTDLTIIPISMINTTASICDGDSMYLGGNWQTGAGNYMDQYTSSNGCDSTVTTQLMLMPLTSSSDTSYVCAGDSAWIGGMWQHVPGVYTYVYQAANGCDSTVNSALIIKTIGCNVDCNGDIGGTAYLDSCGVCVGGNTGQQPCSPGCVSLEVVSFTLVDAGSGLDVRTLYDGDTIDKRQIPSFSIRANACDNSIAPGQIECITFDNGGLMAGNIPSSVLTNLGTGPIGIYGYNPGFSGTNAAMIFNSSSPTGGDFDLGTPNVDFSGPGVGSGGSSGSTFENKLALNNLLIVSEDLDTTDANDLRGMGVLEFDFMAVGPVIVHSLTIVDIEGKEGPPMIRFYNAAGVLFSTISLNTVGNNGVANINFGPVAGVSKMTVHFGGSGALDNLCIETPQTSGSGSIQLPGIPVGSVLFDVNGAFLTRENMAPYAIRGGTKTRYNPWNVGPGSYQVKATPYSSRDGKGTMGIAEKVNLFIVDGTPVPDCNGDLGGSAYIDFCGVCVGGNSGLAPCLTSCQTLEVTSFKLISAVDGSLIGQLNNGDTINRGTMVPFSIRAETCGGPVGSVLFDLNGSVIKKENAKPYDINGGSLSKPNAWSPPLGTHTLLGTPFTNAYGKGTAGISETVNFTVIDIVARVIGGNNDNSIANGQTGEQVGTADNDGNALGRDDQSAMLMKVYPNPTNGKVNVDLLGLEDGDQELVLIDNTGKVLRVINDAALMSPGLLRFELDISNLPDGIYMLRLTAGDMLFDRRLIKQ